MRLTLLLLLALTGTLNAQNYNNGEDLPAPQWRQAQGNRQAAELRIAGENAAAFRVSFRSLTLGDGDRLFLYGKDSQGNIVAIHGPYTGNGPLNVPEFDSRLIPGASLTIAVEGRAGADWPFAIENVQQFAADELGEMQPLPSFQPTAPRPRPRDFRSAYVGDKLLEFEVQDGMAVMQGDVVLGEVNEVIGGGGKGKNQNRASHSLDNVFPYRWSYGTIPFNIAYNANLKVGDELDGKIKTAIAYWNSRFPGTLVNRTTHTDYVTFSFTSGVCRSYPGRKGGQQLIELDNSCGSGNIVHEIGHALGFLHEHNRQDRDNFIKINTANIIAGKEDQFAKESDAIAADIGAYDFGSIMHYSLTAFSKDNVSQTISLQVPAPAGVTIGQRSALSAGDEAGMRSRYCAPQFFVAPSTVEVDNFGGSGQFTVYMPQYCTWTLTDNATWISVRSASSGTGSVTVQFTVQGNSKPTPRSGAIRINGRSITIRQIPDSWDK
ncbi:MAG TPA: M12 family metallopeptidase [Bryobacteraceae bacterium]|nr:M12 family metallopeptidase [Bryobacteraceae bacterium]